MKYKIKNSEVDIKRYIKDLNDKHAPILVDYEVTPIDGPKYYITEYELHENYVPISVVKEIPKADMIRTLAQTIIESEMLVDYDNAETLLHEAVEAAQAIKKLL